jgi:hypothetical protein
MTHLGQQLTADTSSSIEIIEQLKYLLWFRAVTTFQKKQSTRRNTTGIHGKMAINVAFGVHFFMQKGAYSSISSAA